MDIKEQVKDFVHDVKRRFYKGRKRDTCSTFDSYDYSSVDTLSHLDDSSSVSSISSGAGASRQSRFIKFIRPRTLSTTSKKQYHNVLHKVKRVGSKRSRLFSAPSVPSERMVESHYKQAVSLGSSRGMADQRSTLASSQDDYSDVLDISVRGSVQTGFATPETESRQPSSCGGNRDSMQSQPPFDMESHSDTSGTLVNMTSGPDRKSASESDSSHCASLDLHSDIDSEKVLGCAASAPPPVPPMANPPPREEEITLAHSVSSPSSTTPPSLPHAPQALSTPSPAPVFIPRLTVQSMFLPIPNTDPLSALLTKYVPAEQRPRRDVVGEYAGRDVHEMVMSNSWRALAEMARDRIVASDPEDLGRILDLWSLRLSALARLRLTNQATAECTNLFAVLNAVPATSVPGTFPASATLPQSTPLSSSPAPAASSPLSPLSGLAQLPGTPSKKPSTLPPSLAGSATAQRQATHELVHPFELTVFHARVHYWSGDPLGYVDALSRILGRCKKRAREEGRIVMQRRELQKAVRASGGNVESPTRSEQASEGRDEGGDEIEDKGKDEAEGEIEGEGKGEDEPEDKHEDEIENKGKGEDTDENEHKGEDESQEDVEESTEEQDDVLTAAEANLSMWLERIARICLILASQMIEMNDYQAAINLLAPLCTYRAAPSFFPTPSPELHSALARVYLLSGNLQKAEEHFSIAASAAANNANGPDVVAMNTALLAAASGDWTRAGEAFSEMVARDPENFTAINNLAVSLLSQGRINEGIDLFEAALKTSPSSVVVAEPFLFNLSTLYELRSTAAIDKKRGLLIEVAKWSGDGLKTSCLKMPSS